MELLALTVMGRGQEYKCPAVRVVSLYIETHLTTVAAEDKRCVGIYSEVCLRSTFAADLESRSRLRVNSALAENSQPREGAKP